MEKEPMDHLPDSNLIPLSPETLQTTANEAVFQMLTHYARSISTLGQVLHQKELDASLRHDAQEAVFDPQMRQHIINAADALLRIEAANKELSQNE